MSPRPKAHQPNTGTRPRGRQGLATSRNPRFLTAEAGPYRPSHKAQHRNPAPTESIAKLQRTADRLIPAHTYPKAYRLALAHADERILHQCSLVQRCVWSRAGDAALAQLCLMSQTAFAAISKALSLCQLQGLYIVASRRGGFADSGGALDPLAGSNKWGVRRDQGALLAMLQPFGILRQESD